MPTKNAVKQYTPESYYHVYSRGVNKAPVFIDDADKLYFLGLLKRYLSRESTKSSARVTYRSYFNELEVLCYCLMDNHIHLLIYQHDDHAIVGFMRSLMTSYSMYFNRRHKRVGPVFQSRYLASRIDNDSYLLHISRYIHLNPRLWRTYGFSSLSYYLGEKRADWVRPQRVLELFGGSDKYLDFVSDLDANKQIFDELVYDLADGFIAQDES